MSRGLRKATGVQRMQPVLVDRDGRIWPVASPFLWMRPQPPDGNMIGYAVSRLGFIHIWPVDEASIVVALQPDLVDPKTMTAAFYAIADLRPVRVFISATNSTRQRWERFDSVRCALKRIDRLVTAAHWSSIKIKLLRTSLFLGCLMLRILRASEDYSTLAVTLSGMMRRAAGSTDCASLPHRRRATRWTIGARRFLDSPSCGFLPKLLIAKTEDG